MCVLQTMVPRHCPLSQLTDALEGALELLYACNTIQDTSQETLHSSRTAAPTAESPTLRTSNDGGGRHGLLDLELGAGNVDGHAPLEETSACLNTDDDNNNSKNSNLATTIQKSRAIAVSRSAHGSASDG